ncbi:MAG: ATP phosphoribosyltransferase regulatory subunit [Lachnospiraceae bacterium]|nr:ATP phosphoribosyltransferase regulatory subunit [Lachnospiraceae bacterium]
MKRFIHTPEGVRDIMAVECDKKRYLERRIDKLFRSYGYQSIQTPSMEFFDVFAREVGSIPSRDLYKFFDREGNTLVLRPDFTPSIARAAAMYFNQEEMPLRLSYSGSVFQNNSSYQGRLKESTQMGVELLNDGSVEADAEVIALAVQTMLRAGITEFQVNIGEVNYFQSLVEEALLDEDTIAELKQLLEIKNLFGAQELIEKQNLRKDLSRAISEIPGLFGGAEVLKKAADLTGNERAREAVVRLEKIYELLKFYGCEKYVTFDLSMLSKYSYYTGIIFQGFTYGTGDAVITGGRYDDLLEKFGKKAEAIGFVTQVDSLLNAIDRQKLTLPVKDIKTMLLYPAYLEGLAVRFAADHRKQDMEVACVRFQSGHVLDDYSEYGKRNQFGGIIYFASETEVYAINLATGETEPVDVSRYTEGK